MPPIICKERSDSGRLNSDGAEARSIEAKWDVFMRRSIDPTPMDPFAAETRLRESVPFAISDPQTGTPLYAQNFVLEPQDSHYSIGTLQYKVLQGDDALPIGTVPGEDWHPPTFRIFSETINVKFSRATRSTSAGAPNTAQLINITSQNGQNDVNGADILRAKLQFSIPRYYPLSIVSRVWLNGLKSITNTVCSHQFLGHAPGEIFFLGPEGGPNGAKGRMELTFHFLSSENMTNVDVGSKQLPSVHGHDFMWCMYEPGQVGDFMVSTPRHAFAEQVYNEASWGIFGFGA